jgi:hypothetical protein
LVQYLFLYFIAIAMYNASNCDTLARTLGLLLLERYGIHFHEENNRIRCLAHVVNLVVQAILKGLDEVEAEDIVDYFLLNKDQPIHYNEAEDEELATMEAEIIKLTDEELDADDSAKDEVPNTTDLESMSALQRVNEPFWSQIKFSPLFSTSSVLLLPK